MINFKSEEAKELAEILYKMLLEKGEIDLRGIEEERIMLSKPYYGLRRVSAGAIQILDEKEDVEHIKNDKGYATYKYRLLE